MDMGKKEEQEEEDGKEGEGEGGLAQWGLNESAM